MKHRQAQARNANFWRELIALGSSEGPCVEWPGFCNKKGYGVYRRNGQNLLTRSLWVELFGPISQGLIVCHRCDNPPCARPAHLFLGTHQDNSSDAVAKGRMRHPRNELSGKTRLTDEQVAEIRSLRMSGTSCKDIADLFGVHSAHVSRICNGKRRPPYAFPQEARETGWLTYRKDLGGAA